MCESGFGDARLFLLEELDSVGDVLKVCFKGFRDFLDHLLLPVIVKEAIRPVHLSEVAFLVDINIREEFMK